MGKTLGEIRAEQAAAKAAKEAAKKPKKPEPALPAPPEPLLEVTFPEAPTLEVSSEYVPEPYIPPMFDYSIAKANPHAELAARELCRRRLLPFIQRFRPKYMAGWVHADICRRIERFVRQVEEGKEPRLLLMMPPRSGKLLADETPVLTPSGWRTHGDLAPGDEVFHPSGKPVRILAITPKDIADVKMTFSDGSSYYCHENHEWSLFDRKRGHFLTLEAGHFLRPSHLGTPPKLLNGTRSNYQLPVVEALQFQNTAYFMHPYVLGAWLGDGSAGKPCITGAAADRAIVHKINMLGYPTSTVCEHSTTGVLTTYFSGDGTANAGLVPKRRGPIPGRMAQELEYLGIYRDKRIPKQYLRLTVELRLQLLAGLIDTDGTTDAQSRISITTVSRKLAGDIMQLCEGLGFRPYMQEVQPTLSSSGIRGRKVCYVVGFQPTCDIPVALERKRVTRIAQQRRIGLVAVERVTEQRQGHCIQVDSDDGLYVIGKNLTVTHNSEISSRHTPAWILGQHPEWEIIAASHTSSLTMSFSRYLRDLMRDPAYLAVFENAQLDPKSQAVENWNMLKGGGYLAAGVGTGITGRGAHILLLDDLVKDIEAADSITIRDNTWEWYLSTAYTRLAPGGGVLGLMCMTGDTLVTLADGSERRLDTLGPDDMIATYANGLLAVSRVAAMKSSGRDSVFKITTTSGKIVRANQRHPFLTVTPEGELAWTRVKNLTTAHRIVARKVSGGSGEGSLAQSMAASVLQNVEGCVTCTTVSRNGLTDTATTEIVTKLDVMLDSSTAMASQRQSTTPCTSSKADAVQSAANTRLMLAHPATGKTSSPWITVTIPEGCEHSSATTVMPGSDTLRLSKWHLPQQNIFDFTAEQIVSIEVDGEEEVFDLQVDRTENFIANGVVSHNTWWNADDWAGRIQEAMKDGGDKFEIIRYPAINEQGDEYILEDDSIAEIPPNTPVPPNARMTRRHNTAVHPARYTTEAMLRIKNNLIRGGQKRVWDALYQQNPIPDEGNYFEKNLFQYYSTKPARQELRVYQAWDFAISEGKESDYTVGATIGVDHRDAVYVLDIRRFRSSDAFVLIDTIIDYAMEYDVDWLGFEDGQIWKALESQFSKRCREKSFYPSYEVLKPLTDKLVRANPLKGRMQARKVFFDMDAHWFRELQKEMLHFPAGKHDDQIDALAWAVRLTLMHAPPRDSRPQPKLPSWKDKLSTLGGDGCGHMAA